jgi:hypothetical protein
LLHQAANRASQQNQRDLTAQEIDPTAPHHDALTVGRTQYFRDKTCLADTSFSTHQYQRGLTNPRRRGRPFELTPRVVTSDHR